MATPSTTETHKIKLFMTGLRVTAEVPQYFRDLYGSPDEIEAKIMADKQRIADAGYDVTLYYIDERDPESSLKHMEKTLRNGNFDGIMIGTGLRLIPPQTALFEKAVNVARRASPQSLFLYNDGPGGNYDAIKRNDEVNAYIR